MKIVSYILVALLLVEISGGLTAVYFVNRNRVAQTAEDKMITAKKFCYVDPESGSQNKRITYYEDLTGVAFVSCGIGALDGPGGYKKIGEYKNGVWKSIWEGNGELSDELYNREDFPRQILYMCDSGSR